MLVSVSANREEAKKRAALFLGSRKEKSGATFRANDEVCWGMPFRHGFCPCSTESQGETWLTTTYLCLLFSILWLILFHVGSGGYKPMHELVLESNTGTHFYLQDTIWGFELDLTAICNVAPILLSSDLPSVEESVSCLLSIQSPLLLSSSTPILSRCPPLLHAVCVIGGSWALQWILSSLSSWWSHCLLWLETRSGGQVTIGPGVIMWPSFAQSEWQKGLSFHG